MLSYYVQNRLQIHLDKKHFMPVGARHLGIRDSKVKRQSSSIINEVAHVKVH